VFPVALLVLLLVFRSLRLLLLSAFTLVLGLALAMGLMYPISLQFNIVAFAPSIMGTAPAPAPAPPFTRCSLGKVFEL
jgi:hypothetical protein